MTTQNPANRPRALIAMSGGVDSSVAACLMQQLQIIRYLLKNKGVIGDVLIKMVK